MYQQTMGISIGTNCAPLLAIVFLHTYEADYLQIGDNLHCIYPNELEVNDTTDTQKSASDLDFHLEIDNE